VNKETKDSYIKVATFSVVVAFLFGLTIMSSNKITDELYWNYLNEANK